MNKATVVNNKEAKKTIRSKKNIAKPYLYAPLKFKWPHLEPSKQELILKKLKIYFLGTNLKCSLLEIPSKQEKKKNFRPLNQLILSEEEMNIRSQLITGIKEVTRHAERDSLKCILVDRSSPWQLHRHLIQMAVAHHCCAAAIDNLSEHIAPLLELTRLSAVAFRKISADDSKYFVEFLEEMDILIPSIDIPFLSANKGSKEILGLEKIENSVDNESKNNVNTTVPEIINISNNSNLEICQNVVISTNNNSTNSSNFISQDAIIKFIPEDICFLKKRRENDKLNENFEEDKSYIKFNGNEENDTLFLKVPVFTPTELKEVPIISSIKSKFEESAYLKSDVRKKESSIEKS